MIENLKGIYETVNFKENTYLRLYDNEECENYPPHWHTPVEIIMPTENIYTVECCNQRIVLRENDIIIVWPGCLHTLFAPPRGRRIIFQPNINILNDIKGVDTIHSLLSPVTVITPEDYPQIHPQIRTLLLEIKEEYQKDAMFSDASIYAKFLSILVLLGRNYTENKKHFDMANSKQQEYTQTFMDICSYINNHCTEDLNLDYVADLAGFSKFHFTRLFKQFTGVSFYKFVNQKRIAIAEQLLINPDYSITDVAINSGFSSMSSFIRMFKIVKNCTPTEFRSMYTGYTKK